VIYFDGAAKVYFVKRFKIETITLNKRFTFISEARGSKLTIISTEKQPQVEITFTKNGSKEKESIVYDLDLLIEIKGWKAMGNKLPHQKVSNVKLLENKQVEKISLDEQEEIEEVSTPDQLGLF